MTTDTPPLTPEEREYLAELVRTHPVMLRLPTAIRDALQRRADLFGQSLQQEICEVLAESVELPLERPKRGPRPKAN